MDDTITSTILSSMNDGVIVIDFEGRITFSNKAAGEILHIQAHEMANSNYTGLFMSHAENDAFNDILFNGIQNRETRIYAEVPFRRGDGKLIELGVTTSFLRKEFGAGEHEGIVVVFKDITASRELDRARQRVLDHLSHELRTPLTIIRATMKRLINAGNEALGERIGQNLNRLQEIQMAVNDIVKRQEAGETSYFGVWLRQIEDILDVIGEKESEYAPAVVAIKEEIGGFFGKGYSQTGSVSVAEQIEKVALEARESACHRQVMLHTEIEDSAMAWIDPEVLYKSLMTPIKNSIEATPDGGEVFVRLKQDGKYTVFEVKDRGIGITSESQGQIFGGFYHARETDLYSTKKPFDFGAGGKGLELLRLKVFAHIHQFLIEWESKRCIHIPNESQLCPGSIEACPHVQSAAECALTGGTTLKLRFKSMEQ